MNKLNRDIEKDEVVVIKKDIFKPEYKELKYRLVSVQGGFGMKHELIGSALFCTHLEDGEQARYEGYEIDSTATDLYQKEHGKFWKKNEKNY